MTVTVTDEQIEAFDDACNLVVTSGNASTSFLQRELGVGYNDAAKLVEAMEIAGIVSKPNGVGKRRVLVPKPEDGSSWELKGRDGTVIKGSGKQDLAKALDAAMGHNSRSNGADLLNDDQTMTRNARTKLLQTVERIERLDTEKQEIADQIKDVYSEAKASGYDTKALRSVIRIRKQDPDERAEQEAILETYLEALGEI